MKTKKPTLKERILKEMIFTNEEQEIKELIQLSRGIWDEKKIRARWRVLKNEN